MNLQNGGPVFSLMNWSLACLPLVVLLVGLLAFRWKAYFAGLAGLAAALSVGWTVYGGGLTLLGFAALKGLSLTLYVGLIIWASVLLFNIADRSGSVKTITETLGEMVSDKTMLCLLMAWSVSGMIQGVAGFGVPVSIVAPLMMAMGFNGAIAAAATLVGHSWSISFGSMAASYYTIQLVTGLEPERLAFWMGLQFILPTILSGVAVAHIYGGIDAIRQNIKPVFITGLLMAAVMFSAAIAGIYQLASFLAGLSGALIILYMARLARSGQRISASRRRSIWPALFPYLVLIALVLFSLVGPARIFEDSFQFAPDFPAAQTAYGYNVKEETGYAAISLFSHPAPLIMLSLLITFFYYRRKGYWQAGYFSASLDKTWRQCTAPTLGIAVMMMMALVMNDTGMTTMLARGVALVGSALYPILSPYVGVLGCFMTGSNTNSNVLFGSLQVETAAALGLNIYMIAALQSVGGSLGSAIAPAKILLGSASVGMSGREHLIFNRALPYCFLLVLGAGIFAWLTQLFY